MTAGHIIKDQASETAIAVGRMEIVKQLGPEDEGKKKAISMDLGPLRRRHMLDMAPQLCWDGTGGDAWGGGGHRQPEKVETRRTDLGNPSHWQ